jgi:hypothetical protein
MTKFDKVMQNLQDSLDTARTVEDVEWCHVKKQELAALIHAASIVRSFSVYEHQDSCQSVVSELEACADE